jgi:hypothetical protein
MAFPPGVTNHRGERRFHVPREALLLAAPEAVCSLALRGQYGI